MNPRIVSVAAGVSLGVAATVRLTERIPVFGEGRPWLVSSLPSPLVALVLVVAGASVGYVVGRSGAAGRSKHLLALGISAAVFVPGAYALVPSLALFSGRALDFLLAAAGFTLLADACLARVPETSSGTSGRSLRSLAALLSFVLFLAVGFKMSEDVGLSGDEPHYLLITHSLVEDGDLRVQNNYAREDHLLFYRGKIGPHLAAGTEYSIHGVGLPIVLAPGYAAAGITGVLVTLALVGALVVHSLYQVAWRLSDSHLAALLTTVGFAATMPGLFLSVSAYPELPAGWIVTAVASRLLSRRRAGGIAAVSWALLVGGLPFLHMKFIPLAAILWGALATRLGRRGAVSAGAGLAVAVLVTFFYVTTGSVNPTDSYGRQRVFFESIPMGLTGLLFDQEFGLLVFAPFYLVGFLGLVTLARRDRWFAAFALGTFLAVALPGAAHPLWSGGNSPPARFLFPVLPLLAAAVASAWRWDRRVSVVPCLPSLVGIGLAVSSFALWLPGQPIYLNQKDGTGRLWEALSSSWDLTSYLPSIVNADPRSVAWAISAAALLGLALAASMVRRSLWLPPIWLVLLGFLALQDWTGVSLGSAHEGRWVSRFFRELSTRELTGFVSLPGFERLGVAEVMKRVTLPLEHQPADGDARSWWSRPYWIPAGRFAVSGVVDGDWAPCNERACFDSEGDEFVSSVSLARFRLRVRRPRSQPRLRLIEPGGRAPVAERSLALASGGRLHGLDDEAYLDRRGFWVKSGSSAGFVLESGRELELDNGGAANVVHVETATASERYELSPWEKTRVPIPDGSAPLVITSESGFRPSDLDPESSDRRELGVLVGAPRF